jgi:hypothetical protein
MNITHHFTEHVSIKKIFQHNQAWEKFQKKYPQYLSRHKIATVNAMLACRTPVMGAHVYRCPEHSHVISLVPHSCKTKLCASCGTVATQRWLASLDDYLLPCDYKHLNFTIPHSLNPFARKNQKLIVSLLLKAANHAVMSWCEEKGFKPGVVSVVQSFSKRYNYHLHVHLIVTAGGLALDHSNWITDKFMSYKSLEKRFKFKFLELLRSAIDSDPSIVYPKHYDAKRMKEICETAASVFWNNEVGDAIGNPLIVFCYLGRYLKKAIIAESRIVSFDGETVTLMLPEFPSGMMVETKFSQMEFLQLIIQHIPDKHSKYISYSGLFANKNKANLLPIARAKLLLLDPSRAYSAEHSLPHLIPDAHAWRERIQRYEGKDPLTCPLCKEEMKLFLTIFPHDPEGEAYIQSLLDNPKNIIVHNPFIEKNKGNKYQQRRAYDNARLWAKLKSKQFRK